LSFLPSVGITEKRELLRKNTGFLEICGNVKKDLHHFLEKVVKIHKNNN
jgi:hypothetical protein